MQVQRRYVNSHTRIRTNANCPKGKRGLGRGASSVAVAPSLSCAGTQTRADLENLHRHVAAPPEQALQLKGQLRQQHVRMHSPRWRLLATQRWLLRSWRALHRLFTFKASRSAIRRNSSAGAKNLAPKPHDQCGDQPPHSIARPEIKGRKQGCHGLQIEVKKIPDFFSNMGAVRYT
jgi:hypothetical protein